MVRREVTGKEVAFIRRNGTGPGAASFAVPYGD